MSVFGIPMECNRTVYMGPISIVSSSTGAEGLAITLLLPPPPSLWASHPQIASLSCIYWAHHQISLYGAYLCIVIWKLVWYQPIGYFCGGVPSSSRRQADTSFLLPNNHPSIILHHALYPRVRHARYKCGAITRHVCRSVRI